MSKYSGRVAPQSPRSATAPADTQPKSPRASSRPSREIPTPLGVKSVSVGSSIGNPVSPRNVVALATTAQQREQEAIGLEATIQRQQDLALVGQTRTFKKWVNVQLTRGGSSYQQYIIKGDLFEELSSGIVLVHLFVALFKARGLTVPKYNANPTLKAQKLDNVAAALALLPRVGIMTVFLSPDNVVEKNQKLVLGLIWRLILSKQVVALGTDTTLGGDDRKIDQSAKTALLEWVRSRLAPYVLKFDLPPLDNFTTSWSSGVNLLALLHSQDPSLVDLNAARSADPEANVAQAIQLAEQHFKIAPLIDVDDVVTAKPDEKCIMTYVSEFAYWFEIMGKTKQHDLLSEREQALAMREAELERQKFLAAQEQERKEEELRRREQALLDAAAALDARANQQQDEAARRERELLEQQERERAERERAEAERDRLAQEKLEMEERMRQQELANQAMEEAERRFADAAQAFDQFIHGGLRAVEKQENLATLVMQMEKTFPEGDEMLAKVIQEEQIARDAGVISNRFTKLDSAQLELDWLTCKGRFHERRKRLEEPPKAPIKSASPPPIPLRKSSPAVPAPTPAPAPKMEKKEGIWWCPRCMEKVELYINRHCVKCDKYVF